eukprot:TRINITY_DN56090_c0_g1_i1.p1 TRINITY_DN56090_c0_g1~~TRINITY_DN56090_c0_g1_i1.p1  ORF type:complete len:523 (+),score=163.22 TRINITY_DN56090_c0_g1_i1:77-1570(+)
MAPCASVHPETVECPAGAAEASRRRAELQPQPGGPLGGGLQLLDCGGDERAAIARVRCSGRRPRRRLYPTLSPQSLHADCSRVVLFGGWEALDGDDTECSPADRVHVLDLRDGVWEEVLTAGQIPARVAQHAAVPHPTQPGQMLLYGGCEAEEDCPHSLYSLDVQGAEWAALTAQSPLPLPRHSSHTAVADPSSGRVYVFGGNYGVHTYSELWCLCLHTLRWAEMPVYPPPAHLAPYGGDPLRARFAPQGARQSQQQQQPSDGAAAPAPPAADSDSGSDSSSGAAPGAAAEGATILTPSSIGSSAAPRRKRRRHGAAECPRPPRRLYHCSCLARGRVYVFGGAPDPKTTTAEDPVYDDLWYYDLGAQTWVEVLCESGRRPSARGSASCVFTDPFIYIYGGFDGRQDFGCLHRFDVDLQRWEQLTVPPQLPPRWGHACSALPRAAGAGMIVYGGYTSQYEKIYDDVVIVRHSAPSLKYLVAKAALLGGYVALQKRDGY